VACRWAQQFTSREVMGRLVEGEKLPHGARVRMSKHSAEVRSFQMFAIAPSFTYTTPHTTTPLHLTNLYSTIEGPARFRQ
jgi:hypothetical protein